MSILHSSSPDIFMATCQTVFLSKRVLIFQIRKDSITKIKEKMVKFNALAIEENMPYITIIWKYKMHLRLKN